MPRKYESPVEQVGELRIKRFIELITAGLFRVEACRAAQIDPRAVDRWLRAGDKGVELYLSFARRVREAEAGLVVDELKRLRLSDDYRARTWFLERRFPKQWGSQGSGDDELTAGQVDELRDKLRDRLGAIVEQRTAAAAGDQ